MNREVHVLLASIATLCLASTTSIAQAAQVPLTPSSVIGGSGSINDGGGLWDSTDVTQGSGFNATRVVDGSKAENDNLNFWLVNTDEAIDPAYLVIDLGAAYNIDQIDLYNTHNRTSSNFGTEDFRIEASNSVSFVDANFDMDLSGTIRTILTGTLSDTAPENPITTVDSFTSISAHTDGPVRYLKFVAISGISLDNDQRGLNEIEVFSADIVLGEAAEYTWIPSNLGDWADPDNWSFPSGFGAPVNRANSPTHTAIFGTGISGDTTVSTQADVSVNRVVFENSAESYAIAGFGSVILEFDPDDPLDPSDAFGDPSIDVLAGSHQFQAEVNLTADATITVSDDTQLFFSNELDLGSNDLTINDDPGGATFTGAVNINNIVLGTGTITNNATLATASSTSVGGNLTSNGTLGFAITPNSASQFNVSNTASLDGTINVDFLDGATHTGDITLVSSTSVIQLPSGLPALTGTGIGGLSLALSPDSMSLLLTGGFPPTDLNQNGMVDSL
ncbi:MAG: hypothetical protein MK171_08345, partial [Pirellulales bacterium]|nr:hypothetical protein [Pirellulales bacterium]